AISSLSGQPGFNLTGFCNSSLTRADSRRPNDPHLNNRTPLDAFGVMDIVNARIANITISQSQTGKTVENKPGWKATVKNDCICTQSDLKLNSNWFQTVEDVESSVIYSRGAEAFEGATPRIGGRKPKGFLYLFAASVDFLKTPNSDLGLKRPKEPNRRFSPFPTTADGGAGAG
ncbi:hypothetical protein Godav_000599, partial [Gossypium davidsonii]|nr:hypothetical protein [Gossypium davidsonii]